MIFRVYSLNLKIYGLKDDKTEIERAREKTKNERFAKCSQMLWWLTRMQNGKLSLFLYVSICERFIGVTHRQIVPVTNHLIVHSNWWQAKSMRHMQIEFQTAKNICALTRTEYAWSIINGHFMMSDICFFSPK